MLAATRGHLAAVQVFIEAGAALDTTAKYGLSATMLAVINRHGDVARALAEAGADLRLVGTGAPGFAGKNASDIALESGQTDLAGVLSPTGSAV
jgi:ankyrin repeat protein